MKIDTPGRTGRHGLLPAIGTARRMQAMCVIGYPIQWQAQQLGSSASSVMAVMLMTCPMVTERAARAVDELYRRACRGLGPSAKASAWARRRRYVGPGAWDNIDDPDEVPKPGGRDDQPDDEVVRRLLAGERVRAQIADRIEAVRQLAERGAGPGTIADRLHMSSTRAHQILDHLRPPAATNEPTTDLQEAA